MDKVIQNVVIEGLDILNYQNHWHVESIRTFFKQFLDSEECLFVH